jgi:hypothetical protein
MSSKDWRQEGVTNHWEQGMRRRQIRRVERRIRRLEKRGFNPFFFGANLFKNIRLGNLRLRRDQLKHDYTHKV